VALELSLDVELRKGTQYRGQCEEQLSEDGKVKLTKPTLCFTCCIGSFSPSPWGHRGKNIDVVLDTENSLF